MVREKNCGKEGWVEAIVMRDRKWGTEIEESENKLGILRVAKNAAKLSVQ